MYRDVYRGYFFCCLNFDPVHSQRRWVVERLFAWLHWFRRLVVRYEFHAENFLGMVRLGCMKIVLRYL